MKRLRVKDAKELFENSITVSSIAEELQSRNASEDAHRTEVHGETRL
jgi:hypothetical protein